MKYKIKYIIILIGLSLVMNTGIMAQNDAIGSWLVSSTASYDGSNSSSTDENGNTHYKLEFSNNGMIGANNPTVLFANDNAFETNFVYSLGAYNCANDIDTYITDMYYFYNGIRNQYENDHLDFLDVLPQAQMIRSPWDDPDYLLFYSYDSDGGGNVHGFTWKYAEIKMESNGPVFNIQPGYPLQPTSNQDSKATQIISNTVDDMKYIFVLFGFQSNYYSGELGLKKFVLDNSDLDLAPGGDLLIDESSNDFPPTAYFGYNIEMQNKNEVENPVIAWITYPNPNNANDIMYFYDDSPEFNGDHFSLDFGVNNPDGLVETGNIAGFEFSPFEEEEDNMYLSCENLGLIKINWHTGALIEQINSTDFNHSFVQKAPDGNIYVVSNDGTGFGRISKLGNHTFNPTAFQYPFYINQNGITQPFRLTHINYYQVQEDDVKYFTLPENDFELLHSEETLTHAECDNDEGTALIQALGGVAPYSILVTFNNQDISSSFTYNPSDHTFFADELEEGIYYYSITDADLPSCTKTGMFQILDIDPYTYEEDMLIISQNNQDYPTLDDMIWDIDDEFPNNTIMFKHGFVLTDGVTLTINNLNLEFDQQWNAKVIIEPGSKLIINNSTLTDYHCVEPGKWAGVEVWGDPSHNQEPKPGGGYYQGYLELNNSTIENAQTAINIRKDGTWNEYGGGIVKADNTLFKNNALSLHFAPFKNMFTRTIYVNNIPQTLIFEKLNECEFNKCDFMINSEYLSDSKFYKHADIVQVHRIPFKGCNFILDNTTENIATYNCGIAAWSAGVNIDKANDDTPSSFTGFYCAFLTDHSPVNLYYSIIKESQFINNSVGIRNNETNHMIILNNHFEIGENNGGKGACGWAPGYGIDHRIGTNFIIENNTFQPYQGTAGDTYGIRIFETQTVSDEIYHNEFDDLSIGNFSDGLNTPNGDDAFGLDYGCNYNIENDIDFWISGSAIPTMEIHHFQGTENYAAGNTFSSSASMHIQNDGQEIVKYYYFTGSQAPDPDKCTDIYIDLEASANSNTCPDHYGGPGGRGIGLSEAERQTKEDEFIISKTNYQAVESLYNSLTDGGNTEGTTLTIAAAQPSDTWELRANLLGMSPYLSKEVLIEASDKTEVLPESVLFEILSANPDELRKADLLEYLENKEQPLPEYIMNILRQMAGGSTAKTALLSQMGEYKKQELGAVKEIIHSILIEDELDNVDLRIWLANMESYNADKQITASYMDEEDYNSAQALMNLLPELYNLQEDALSEHNDWVDFMDMQISWKADGRNPANLTDSEIVVLTDMADNAGNSVKYAARGILEHFYGENYIDCCTPLDEGNKSSIAYTTNDLAKAMGLSIIVTPNPAKVYTEFTYTLPYGENQALLNIFDISGRLIEQLPLNSPIKKQAYNTRNLPAGTYTIEIKTSDYSYSTKLIVQ